MRLIPLIVAAILLGAALASGQAETEWNRKTDKRLDALAIRFWQGRPATRFAARDAEAWRALLEEARTFPAIPAGKTEALVERIWKQAKKYGPKPKKKGKRTVIDTPYGEAWFLRRGRGKGKSLLIGLHGGGEGAGDAGEPAGTWNLKGSIGFYPQGIRLVHDTWNTVHGERFILSLIDLAKVQDEIDHDRVYVAGFSMGGTGSWFMAGRHPDLLAGAIPAAGVLMASPKSQLAKKEEIKNLQHGLVPNIRNLPLWSYIGLADRNCMPGTFLYVADRIAELKAADPGGYSQFHFKTIPGLAHAYPPGEPKSGLDFLQKQRRNPYPEKLVWEYASAPFPLRIDADQTTRLAKRDFYWIHCDEPEDRQVIRAWRKGTRFHFELERDAEADGLAIWLNDAMVGQAEKIEVVIDGGEAKTIALPPRSLEMVLRSLEARLDKKLCFDRRVDL
jgi:pimeloyl-ACP methyl ester carboxylesterase